MLHVYSQLLILSSLLHTTFSAVYYVIPDDHYTTNNNTYTLQHYLNNINKYFTSHTQLHFLPGQYYLNTDLIIQHVSNLSLIGNRTNEVINSVIKCTSPAGIVVVGSNNIVIANFEMKECGKNYKSLLKKYSLKIGYALNIFAADTASIFLKHLILNECKRLCGIKMVNVWGNVSLSSVAAIFIDIIWFSTEPKHTNLITGKINLTHLFFKSHDVPRSLYPLSIRHSKSFSNITISVENINFIGRSAVSWQCDQCSGHNMLYVSSCNFGSRNTSNANPTVNIKYKTIEQKNHILHKVVFKNCTFTLNDFPGSLLSINYYGDNMIKLIVLVTQSVFHRNKCTIVCQVNLNKYRCTKIEAVLLSFADVVFTKHNVFSLVHTNCISAYIKDAKIFKCIGRLSIITALSSTVTFHNTNKISNSFAATAITARKIVLKEPMILNFSQNNFINVFVSKLIAETVYLSKSKISIENCLIQYTSTRGNLDYEFKAGVELNYSIFFYENNITQFNDDRMAHCSWEVRTAFVTSIPLHVMKRVLHFIDNQFSTPSILAIKRNLCVCYGKAKNCNQEEIGPFFPGQLVTFSFYVKYRFQHLLFNMHNILLQPIKSDSVFVCNTSGIATSLIAKECNNAAYKISHKNGEWCEFSVLIEATIFDYTNEKWVEQFTILLRPCPLGFSLHAQGYCQCDPILSSHIPSLTTCDIDHQTIPRPANTWISAHTINNSHSYHVSLHCPFDYCLPHSSQLNLFTLDSQCQFNRSGVLCGQCQNGLSTVFGSSQCKQCSNLYLISLLIFAVAGVLLIFCMLAFNVTITNGNVNGFLLLINILDFNQTILLSSHYTVMYYAALMINLNLGIETCFYDGMDDYAKIWLQLAFPMYLIFIATLLIITSRYSTTIQRLTARRALPVLATLFLLSYTKVLLTVSNVLFSYTSITHLPSNHTTLVWSVDANIPLFGVKFVGLSITSSILFFFLITFTIILTFSNKLTRFRIQKYFKPLLDAYQSPFKKQFHYWTGLHLIIRATFWGLSFLRKDVNVILSILLLGLIICVHERVAPYHGKLNNTLEIVSLLNLYAIFVIACAYGKDNILISILIMVTLVKFVCIIVLSNKTVQGHLTTLYTFIVGFYSQMKGFKKK